MMKENESDSMRDIFQNISAYDTRVNPLISLLAEPYFKIVSRGENFQRVHVHPDYCSNVSTAKPAIRSPCPVENTIMPVYTILLLNMRRIINSLFARLPDMSAIKTYRISWHNIHLRLLFKKYGIIYPRIVFTHCMVMCM